MDMNEIKIKVSRVMVKGLVRTKNDIVVEQIKDVLNAKDLSEMLKKADEGSNRLTSMNVFKHVTVILDIDKGERGGSGKVRSEIKEGGRGGGGDGVPKMEVTYLVEESGWIKSSIGAEAGTQSGGANISLGLRNLLGRAEQVEFKSSTAFPHWGHTVQLQLSKPHYKDLSKRFFLSIGTTDNKVPVSGYQEYITGGSSEIEFPSPLGEHNLGLEYKCRQLYGFTYNVPMEIREEAGYSVKSSIKHVIESDERDNPNFPKNGRRVKMTNEIAGIGGNVHFSKAEIFTEYLLEIYRDWVVSLNLMGGYLNAFTPSKINDRFLLGGPSTLRGFGMWGVGPRENGYSIGGEAFWASGLHMYAPLPLLPRDGLFGRIRCHAFATAGNIIGKASLSPAILKSLARNIRFSCGAGLHFKLGVAQIELNYTVPLKAHSNDQIQPGLQFGIGLDML